MESVESHIGFEKKKRKASSKKTVKNCLLGDMLFLPLFYPIMDLDCVCVCVCVCFGNVKNQIWFETKLEKTDFYGRLLLNENGKMGVVTCKFTNQTNKLTYKLILVLFLQNDETRVRYKFSKTP